MYPAAFRRLCVETFCAFGAGLDFDPAAFRRLCVETKQRVNIINIRCQPPSGGCVLKLRHQTHGKPRLTQPPSGGCVLKPQILGSPDAPAIPAAFRRLCVETAICGQRCKACLASRLQAAVC